MAKNSFAVEVTFNVARSIKQRLFECHFGALGTM